MDETRDLLRAIMGRLDEMGAQLKGLDQKVDGLGQRLTGVEQKVDGLDQRLTGVEQELRALRTDTNERLEKIEERMDYFAEKWMEHDQEIHKIKRRQA